MSDLDTTSAALDTLATGGGGRVAISSPKPRERACGRIPVDYVTALRRAGGAPFVVSTFAICPDEPEVDDLEVHSGLEPGDTALLDEAAGLLLTGGGDVDPARYGQERHARTYNVSGRRDAFEFDLLEVALERDMPVLAICRGMQVLNVFLGGTLEQHLLDSAGRLEHDRDRPRAEAAHEVRFAPGSAPAEWFGARAAVNSHHHQALDVVADPLREAGRSEDGVLEAVTSCEHSWVVGVQWHPEAMVPVDHAQLALFSAFVEAVRRHERVTRWSA
ncbi:MAG: gamma-glutamyl-gamma-aminobutyrate hydrolase family protein [Actinomycetota bacterium]